MTLLAETLSISACMLLLNGLPLFLAPLRNYSKWFFLLGTGALSGILLFDLLPDLFEMGGSPSLWGVAAVWGLYTVLHVTHLKHHQSEDGRHSHAGHPSIFLASMIGHCLASGVMLVASEGLAKGINHTVFLALLSHKAYESLTVSSILIEKQSSRRSAILSIALYAVSLPVGVALTYGFHTVITQSVALLATSLAAGTLLGCLIFDFLLPSLSQIRSQRKDAAWIVVGLALTQLIMRVL